MKGCQGVLKSLGIKSLHIPHGSRLEAFKEEVRKIFPCCAIKTLVILALIPRSLNISEKISLGIYDLQMVIAIGVWLGVKYLVPSANKLEILLMHLVFITKPRIDSVWVSFFLKLIFFNLFGSVFDIEKLNQVVYLVILVYNQYNQTNWLFLLILFIAKMTD